jgi:hypothetical protein
MPDEYLTEVERIHERAMRLLDSFEETGSSFRLITQGVPVAAAYALAMCIKQVLES